MSPLSKIKHKLYASLSHKKYRQEHRLLIVEGIKMVREALNAEWKVESVIVEEGKAAFIPDDIIQHTNVPVLGCENSAFKQLSSQINPEGVLAVVHFPENQPGFGEMLPELSSEILRESPGFILDNIQDPGNVGTILRIADWFGMKTVICTEGTADILNPKTLRSSMGAVFRVKVIYVQSVFPGILHSPAPVVVADMEGEDLAEIAVTGREWVVLGNEANGVHPEISALSSISKVHISGGGKAESLNVGVAAGIFAYKVCQKQFRS